MHDKTLWLEKVNIAIKGKLKFLWLKVEDKSASLKA